MGAFVLAQLLLSNHLVEDNHQSSPNELFSISDIHACTCSGLFSH